MVLIAWLVINTILAVVSLSLSAYLLASDKKSTKIPHKTPKVGKIYSTPQGAFTISHRLEPKAFTEEQLWEMDQGERQ